MEHPESRARLERVAAAFDLHGASACVLAHRILDDHEDEAAAVTGAFVELAATFPSTEDVIADRSSVYRAVMSQALILLRARSGAMSTADSRHSPRPVPSADGSGTLAGATADAGRRA